MRHYIYGGRFGDVCHSIPAAYEYHLRTGQRVRFSCSAEFASILEGCSYIEPYAIQVPWQRINDIHRQAKNNFPGDDFVVMACYGHDYSPGYETYSFLRESWRLSGCQQPPETVPLVFDRRSLAREEKLIKQHVKTGKPVILVSTKGSSSPFNNAHLIYDDVRNARPDCEIVDLNFVKAERVFDLLGLYEKAVALVTIDTMHLHLSSAVPSLPVFAFICDGHTRWNRSDWRPQQVFRCVYAQYMDRRALFRSALTSMNAIPHIYHMWSHLGPRDGDTGRRMNIAQDSWHREAGWAGNWTLCELGRDKLPRLMTNDGDLPYIKDMINAAFAEGAKDTDIISISNSDVGCIHGFTSQILDSVRECGTAYTHRHDLHNAKIEKPITLESEVARRCQWYPGSDWFFFTAGWWKRHQGEFPDMVIGREFWDCVLRQLLKKHGSREIQNAVWHEKHPTQWDKPGNRENLPGNKHNRALATQFFVENKSNDRDPFRTTWNLQPGTTANVDPRHTRNLQPTHKNPNLVFPRRLQTGTSTINRTYKKIF
jgi:hypothetical protein